MKVHRQAALRYIDRFIVLSPFHEQWVREHGIPKPKIAYKSNWVNAKPTFTNNQRSGFVFVGRLEASKGIQILLEAWQQMPVDAMLTVVGTGSMELELHVQYQNDKRIQFFGARTQEETLKIIGRSRFLVQPSLWYETFGLTILEAMAQGIPVIGFDIGTRKDLICDGETGYLCMPETLVATLQKAMSVNHYDLLSNNALAFAQQYKEALVLDHQIALYQEWIDQHER